MGVAVAQFAAQAITAALVSKVATKVLTELGMSESTAGLLGGIAGIAAGGYVGSQMAASTQAGTAADVGKNAQAVTQPTPGGNAVAGANVPGTPLVASGGEALTTAMPGSLVQPGAANGGQLMSRPTPDAAIGSTVPVDSSVVPDASIVKTVAPPVAPESAWYEKLFDSDKFGDVLGGVAQGAAGGMLQADAIEERERQRIREEQRKEYKGNVPMPQLQSYGGIGPKLNTARTTTTTAPKPRQLMRRATA